jgi:hypothetical protein
MILLTEENRLNVSENMMLRLMCLEWRIVT